MPETRGSYALKFRQGRTWLFGVVVAVTVAALAAPSPGTAAEPVRPAASAPALPGGVIDVDDGMLTVDLRDVDLESALLEIASRAGFHLTITGQLGHVTATFAGVPLEEGLRRLVRDHELMLVYGAPEGSRTDGGLMEVQVFAGLLARDPLREATGLAEINRLLRAGGAQGGVARLAELVATAPDSTVRARAAWALGRIGGTAAEATLAGALSDQAPSVRVQAVYALKRVAGMRAIPALQGPLLGDPDVAVRRAAARMLGGLREAHATSALRAAAGDPDAAVRQEVARALRRHGVVLP